MGTATLCIMDDSWLAYQRGKVGCLFVPSPLFLKIATELDPPYIRTETGVCDYLTLYLIEALVGGVTWLRLLHHGIRGNLELA